MAAAIVLGATSAIAHATARIWAARGDTLVLVARDAAKLEAAAQDLRVRGAARVEAIFADLADLDGQGAALEEAARRVGPVDIALVAYGVLGDAAEAKASPRALASLLQVDFVSAAILCERLVAGFERQGRGTLAVVGSVAGDRGRQSNYAYGSAKGGLAIFLDGLRHRFAGTAIRIVTIKPGFVDTPMTAAFPKGPLWASPAAVAAGIDRAIARGTPVAYVPGFWRAIMLVVRNLPDAVLFRTKL